MTETDNQRGGVCNPPKPYYEQDGITIYHGDCREILPSLSFDLVVTDPPYGEGMGFEGDATTDEARSLVVGALRSMQPEPGTYMALFWTMRSLDILLDAVRSVGWSYSRTAAMLVPSFARPHLGWLPRLQPIVIFRMGSKASELHDRFSVYAKHALDKSGKSMAAVARELGCDGRLVQKWTRYRDPSWCLPTGRFYSRFKSSVGLGNDFDDEIMSRESEEGFKPDRHVRDLLEVRHGAPATSHPCEKPVDVMRSVVGAMPGGVVLDFCCGSGATLEAARDEGRRAIGIEIEERYCEIAAKRLAQGVLFGSHDTENSDDRDR